MSRHKYKLMHSLPFEKVYLCEVCDCQKTVTIYKGYKSTTYIRSGLLNEYSPQCVDMLKENSKTID